MVHWQNPSWLNSIIVPILKPNKPAHLPPSYRPISLASNVCKLLKKRVVCRLNWFLEYHNILNHKVCGVGNASVFLAISLHALSASHRDMTV